MKLTIKNIPISQLIRAILTEYTKKTENPEFDDSTDKLIQVAERKPEQKVSLSMANVDLNCVIIIEATAEAYGLSIAAIVRLIILDYLSQEEIPNVHTEDTTDDIKDTKDISHEE